MDFGSIVESLSSRPFTWATGAVSSACAHNCFDKNHYHRHCGCALHSIDTGFKGSPACSPPYSVKVSGAGPRVGRICRSISVQNLGDKKFQSGNVPCDPYSKDVAVTTAAFVPSRRSSSVSSLSQLGMDKDDLPSTETPAWMEELTSFSSIIKDEDAGSNRELHNNEIERDSSGGSADEAYGAQALPTFLPQSQPIVVSSVIASSRPSLQRVRLSLLEIHSVTPSTQ